MFFTISWISPISKGFYSFFKQFRVFLPLGCFEPGLFKFGLVHGLTEEGNTIQILQTNRQTDERSVQLMFNWVKQIIEFNHFYLSFFKRGLSLTPAKLEVVPPITSIGKAREVAVTLLGRFVKGIIYLLQYVAIFDIVKIIHLIFNSKKKMWSASRKVYFLIRLFSPV